MITAGGERYTVTAFPERESKQALTILAQNEPHNIIEENISLTFLQAPKMNIQLINKNTKIVPSIYLPK